MTRPPQDREKDLKTVALLIADCLPDILDSVKRPFGSSDQAGDVLARLGYTGETSEADHMYAAGLLTSVPAWIAARIEKE